jgi:hypothetical protein
MQKKSALRPWRRDDTTAIVAISIAAMPVAMITAAPAAACAGAVSCGGAC